MTEKKMLLRRQQDSNLRRQSPTDFESVSLTTRTYRLCVSLSTKELFCLDTALATVTKSGNTAIHYIATENNICLVSVRWSNNRMTPEGGRYHFFTSPYPFPWLLIPEWRNQPNST